MLNTDDVQPVWPCTYPPPAGDAWCVSTPRPSSRLSFSVSLNGAGGGEGRGCLVRQQGSHASPAGSYPELARELRSPSKTGVQMACTAMEVTV